ncbi:MAG: AAA family ATPase [Candidatus Aminicenantes bacterium]|jgi:cell division control protein 6
MIEDYPVVTKPNLLNEAHFPKDICARDFQVDELLSCLRPAYKKDKPIHAWLFGAPGTGKTLVARHALKRIEKDAYVKGIYVNCWECNSYYSVLDYLVRELRILGAEKLNTSFKLERFRQFIEGKPFLIVLDEIDHLKGDERDSIIYNLCNIGNIGLICISNSNDALCTVDDRIKSRLSAKQIEFGPYTGMELVNILNQRAQFALRQGACSEGVLKIIAHYAEGDARAAIQVLKNASYFAEKDMRKRVELKDIKAGYSSTKNLGKTRFLDKLSSHHRLLYELVKKKREVNSGELWKVYLSECKRLNKQPIAIRTYSEYMNKLIEIGLVLWDRALVRGKVRVFKIPN